MLKFKKIELLTKTDKNPSVNQNTDAEKREIFWGGWLFAVGESWDGDEEGEIGEERVNNILTFVDGFTDGTILSVILSARLMINRARHRTELPFWIPRWFRRQFHRWIGHVTVRSWRFESLGDSVGKKYPQ